jgi:hypothetical protein
MCRGKDSLWLRHDAAAKKIARLSQDEVLEWWHECRRKHGLELGAEDEQVLEELKDESE